MCLSVYFRGLKWHQTAYVIFQLARYNMWRKTQNVRRPGRAIDHTQSSWIASLHVERIGHTQWDSNIHRNEGQVWFDLVQLDSFLPWNGVPSLPPFGISAFAVSVWIMTGLLIVTVLLTDNVVFLIAFRVHFLTGIFTKFVTCCLFL